MSNIHNLSRLENQLYVNFLLLRNQPGKPSFRQKDGFSNLGVGVTAILCNFWSSSEIININNRTESFSFMVAAPWLNWKNTLFIRLFGWIVNKFLPAFRLCCDCGRFYRHCTCPRPCRDNFHSCRNRGE